MKILSSDTIIFRDYFSYNICVKYLNVYPANKIFIKASETY